MHHHSLPCVTVPTWHIRCHHHVDMAVPCGTMWHCHIIKRLTWHATLHHWLKRPPTTWCHVLHGITMWCATSHCCPNTCHHQRSARVTCSRLTHDVSRRQHVAFWRDWHISSVTGQHMSPLIERHVALCLVDTWPSHGAPCHLATVCHLLAFLLTTWRSLIATCGKPIFNQVVSLGPGSKSDLGFGLNNSLFKSRAGLLNWTRPNRV